MIRWWFPSPLRRTEHGLFAAGNRRDTARAGFLIATADGTRGLTAVLDSSVVTCEDCEQGGTKGTPGRGRIYADDWEQASHNGDLAHTVKAGVLGRDDVAQLGDVLIGTAEGRQSERDITVFDPTGLAIQDLAIALAAMERADGLELQVLVV